MLAESNYSQLDKEGLVIVFGIQHFHKYMYSQNWRDYDFLSLTNRNWYLKWLCLWVQDQQQLPPLLEHSMKAERNDRFITLMSALEISSWTGKDHVLSRVRQHVLKGWPQLSDNVNCTGWEQIVGGYVWFSPIVEQAVGQVQQRHIQNIHRHWSKVISERQMLDTDILEALVMLDLLRVKCSLLW